MLTETLKLLFERDLKKLRDEIEAYINKNEDKYNNINYILLAFFITTFFKKDNVYFLYIFTPILCNNINSLIQLKYNLI